MSPNRDLARDLERELQIQEYSAGIDALTGGYLTRGLEQDAIEKVHHK